MKKRKMDEEELIRKLKEDSDEFVKQAAAIDNVDEMKLLIVKAQSLKESAKVKESTLSSLNLKVQLKRLMLS